MSVASQPCARWLGVVIGNDCSSVPTGGRKPAPAWEMLKETPAFQPAKAVNGCDSQIISVYIALCHFPVWGGGVHAVLSTASGFPHRLRCGKVEEVHSHIQ